MTPDTKCCHSRLTWASFVSRSFLDSTTWLAETCRAFAVLDISWAVCICRTIAKSLWWGPDFRRWKTQWVCQWTRRFWQKTRSISVCQTTSYKKASKATKQRSYLFYLFVFFHVAFDLGEQFIPKQAQQPIEIGLERKIFVQYQIRVQVFDNSRSWLENSVKCFS